MDRKEVMLLISAAALTWAFTITILDQSIRLGNVAKELISECESNLSRDQHCVLIAVVEE